jgi:4-amino-4-deoxy-L-arabinose transferase-like glycosyltransferase
LLKKSNSWIGHVLFAVVMSVSLVTGFLGMDYGGHWDEPRMRRTIRTGVFEGRVLPGWYNYPSLTYGIVASALLPEIITQSRADDRTLETIQANVFGPGSTLRVRSVFLVVTLLAVVWLYVAVFMWRRSVMEALLAAGMLGMSWEVAYHARWIAPDGVLMQFAALFVLLVMAAVKWERHAGRWLVAAAAVAGLACGTKYPGGILLLPLLIYSHRLGKISGGISLARRRVLAAIAVFVIAFVATTPGTLFEFGKFLRDVGFEMKHYSSGHAGYSVGAGPGHIALASQYLALVAFSKFWPLALMLFVFGVPGAAYVWRNERRLVLLLLWVPLGFSGSCSCEISCSCCRSRLCCPRVA